ncbi:50S ribosomal protein L24 [Thermoflexibacter ruber]|uniref:Large ribosomal subunit protein uL24 n=1 Tax=Thermoflexibacter ruber TaxID=1003 RepID=A0A1I2I5F8_9BACT|nr:50S ribosomal protein L24 [Thermoflexibacter ruber]SFF36853.1 large subunit ribosomal protein L24 [Thermoflexibacter ruber]
MKKLEIPKHKKLHVRTGDKVIVIAGNEKGRTGIVTKILRDKQRVIVEGLNIAKKAVKPSNDNPEGGFIEKELGIHISNVMLVDPKTGKPTRIGRKEEKDAKTGKVKLVRYAKKSGEIIKN